MASSLIEDYEKNGFIFVPSVLTRVEVDVLTNDLETTLKAKPEEPRVILEKDGATPRTVLNPHLYSELYRRLVRHPSILQIVEELLREQVYVFQMGVNCKAAFSGDIWPWHQDYPAYLQDDHIPSPRMVNALIFLDDVTSLNSPVMLVPGSHRSREKTPAVTDQGTSHPYRYAEQTMIKDQVSAAGIVAPTGQAGSAIFMDVSTLHGSTANISPWTRRLITVTYNAFSNKATSPSVRGTHFVPDDRHEPPLAALDRNCLSM